MIGFAETLGATLGSFLVPAVLGLLVISFVARSVKGVYVSAFAVGLFLWFFSDTIGDAAYLSANLGFSGGFWQFAIWLVFAAGLVALFAADRGVFAPDPGGPRNSFTIPLLVAVAIGVHGFGEGSAIGATAVASPASDILSAFGGQSPAVAFTLHKALEPMIIGAAYWVYAKDRAMSPSALLRDVITLAVVFALPGVIGSATAYYLVQVYPTADFSYVFALGLGTSIYALARLARPLYTGNATSSRESLKVGLLIVLGFTCLYLAALFHS